MGSRVRTYVQLKNNNHNVGSRTASDIKRVSREAILRFKAWYTKSLSDPTTAQNMIGDYFAIPNSSGFGELKAQESRSYFGDVVYVDKTELHTEARGEGTSTFV
jgi:hypothetical protein